MTINTSDIEIKIKLLKSEATLAQVTIILFGVWEEKGWRVSRSKIEDQSFHDYVWIQPPSYRSGSGKWQGLIFINDRQLYQEVYTKIYDAYVREKNKEMAGADYDDINPEEVDKVNE